MQRVQFLAGFVLHTRALRETSLLVDVLTPDYGVTRLVARGARSSRSRIRPLAQPFQPLLVSWSGAHELKTLTALEEQGRSYALEKINLACAYYLNELLLRLLPPDQPCATVFARYAASLAELSTVKSAGATIESILRHFEIELLDSMGLLPNFAHCVRVQSAPQASEGANSQRFSPVSATAIYNFYPEQGYAIEDDRQTDGVDFAQRPALSAEKGTNVINEGFSSPVIKVSGSTLLALAERQFDDKSLQEAKNVMRSLLALHLGTRPLKTREMIAFYTKAD